MTSARSERAVTRVRIAGWALVIFLSLHPVAVLPPIAHASEVQGRVISPAEREYRNKVAFADGKISSLRKTARIFHDLSREPISSRLGDAERMEIAEYDRWLQRSAGRCEGLAKKWEQGVERIRTRCEKADAQCDFLAAAKETQEMNQSFNLQYLQLQSGMQNENRQYSMVSNIMKTKHDTVKNSIGNIR